MPVSAIAGVAMSESAAGRVSLPRALRSLRLQLNLLVVLFLVLPVVLYAVFSATDRDRSRLAIDVVRDNGLLISTALKPELESLTPERFDQLQALLARFESPQRSIELLFKPVSADGGGGFYFLAGVPAIPASQLAVERSRLVSLGILDRLARSCGGNAPLSEKVSVPEQGAEILTSVSPVQTPSGCWAIVIAANAHGAFAVVDDQAYWERPAMRLALAIYVAMAVIAISIFMLVSTGLRRLRETAQAVEGGSQFADAVEVPELLNLARDFDQMVDRLRGTAALLKQAAEENAHALKGPLAVIRQSIEPLPAMVEDPVKLLAVQKVISVSLDRLDGLVQSARRLDIVTAELLDPHGHDVDLSGLVAGFADEFALMLGERAAALEVKIEPGISIQGEEDLIEVILENLVDNAFSFSPADGRVALSLRREGGEAVLTVADSGPGVAPTMLTRIFDRYFSYRPGAERGENPAAHYGIGLWLVRHHVGIMRGTVEATNRPEGGLVMTVRLPRVDAKPA